MEAGFGNLDPLPCREWRGLSQPTCLWPLLGFGLVTSPIPLCWLGWTPPRMRWFSQPQQRLPHCSRRQAPPGFRPPTPQLAGNTNQMLGLWPVVGGGRKWLSGEAWSEGWAWQGSDLHWGWGTCGGQDHQRGDTRRGPLTIAQMGRLRVGRPWS